MDSELSVKLWYKSTVVPTEIYNMIYHATLKEAPDWIWDTTKRSIHDIRMWRNYIEAIIDNHVPNLNPKTVMDNIWAQQ